MALVKAHEVSNIHLDQFEVSIFQLTEALAQGQSIAPTMSDVLAVLGQQLHCDRVFLYMRSPQSKMGRVPFCWRARPSVPVIYDPDWKPEDPALVQDDPMFAAAIDTQPSLFIEDVETADPEVLNREFERQTFGHRALIHAHLSLERNLWGILQACVFDHPRTWSQSDRRTIEQSVAWLTPIAMTYVRSHYSPENGAEKTGC
ncbi:MAG: GAF domain-containing protein [Nodosilinea sp.]